jgi:hypothetical protein
MAEQDSAKVIRMSASSIIQPVATRHRHSVRVQGIKAVHLYATVVLLCSAAAPAAAQTPAPPSLEKNSFYLSSAGFHAQFANDPAGQKAMRALPAHQFVAKGAGEELRYFYAEPQRCACIFVGTQQAYDNYREILRQPLKPADNMAPDYKSQAGMMLNNQPLRQSTRGDPTTLSDYLSTLKPQY